MVEKKNYGNAPRFQVEFLKIIINSKINPINLNMIIIRIYIFVVIKKF